MPAWMSVNGEVSVRSLDPAPVWRSTREGVNTIACDAQERGAMELFPHLGVFRNDPSLWLG